MNRPSLPPRLPELVVGSKGSFRRTITEADVALFIGVTWDVNPLHTDEIYAAQTPLGRRIIPGLLTASLLTHMGGLWAFLAQSFHLEFLAPVYVEDTLIAEVQVAAIEARGRLRLDCRISNQDGVEVLRGEIWGYPGLFERRE